ncbi:aldehyde dehydrogenase family protein [Brevibacillus centrosporus]|jgi:acyl-CoA reductase-like NAD-dependent aldehyde dehydrogenase|uniref:aldehyde dehydrogenase family protein n=1 Tax=Brevibacillus centrosporus TaxID=54910 RepID=UPI000F0A7867|nr:aldehyde dehydrogenase family protein [Brevibacillus centrosporus]MEC2129564.1 aldehyde dehydrogenase family protein [Brevibacillus centrosporus]MED4908991.1 aldehyde dehydrogenase family protein [Brevibacillus centrosporus]RNB65449.1 aldehyde dehydrogenase family protein [Brevibacillus centrosporus]GED29918.1 aldehyde dehydrogenase [Brevibacillus centrosporus]
MLSQTERFYFGSFIDGQEVKSEESAVLEVRNPYNNQLIGKISCATKEDVEQAITVSQRVFQETMKKMPAYRRSDILRKTADLLESRTESFANLLVLETGKPIREARVEVDRAVQVLRFASEGAKQIHGEEIQLDSAHGGENQFGFTKRYPIGVVVAITPFNFPLNLVLHKVAPAIAAGNTIVLKPAEKTPLSPVMLYQLFMEAGLPAGALNIVMGPGQDLAEPLVKDPRVKRVTFTGSGQVGWKLKELAGHKNVTLELGSNAPNLVFEDADLDAAAAALVRGGVVTSGQACISVQRIYVQRSVYQALLNKLVDGVRALRVGNPLDEATDVGPMITEAAAARAEEWIREAAEQGATVLTGGKRSGALLEPAVLTNVSHEMKVVCQEIFAPVFSVIPFDEEAEAIAQANASDLGLHAGVFTKDISRALRVAEALETGGVWINDASIRRYDHIPYGGVKQSGIGKEGVAYAIEEMTEIKFIGIKL